MQMSFEKCSVNQYEIPHAHRTMLRYLLVAITDCSLVLLVLFTHCPSDDQTQAQPQESSDQNPYTATSQGHAERPHHTHTK